jgi:hypothetical protein
MMRSAIASSSRLPRVARVVLPAVAPRATAAFMTSARPLATTSANHMLIDRRARVPRTAPKLGQFKYC